MKILVINSGSSSIKYQLFDMDRKAVLTGGLIERIGLEAGRVIHRRHTDGEVSEVVKECPIPNHEEGLRFIANLLIHPDHGVLSDTSEIDVVGHRVVHGGEHFSATTLIDGEVLNTIRRLIPLAPLHNPPNLMGIEVSMKIFPHAKQVAVFDTAFHQTMPPEAYRYAIPNALYRDHGVRVYGFHGTSHRYVSRMAARHLGTPLGDTNLITAHLGNGASITAVKNGCSVDTSMGFSPLPGLVMGTRCGDIDPAVIFYLEKAHGMTVDDIDTLLNKESGLLGVGGSSDLRDILAKHAKRDPDATLALSLYVYRIKKYIGAYMAILGRVDALVFTAGVGENSPYIRWHACKDLEHLGIVIDKDKNNTKREGIFEIHAGQSRVKVLVIPTNEELEIATQAQALIDSANSL
ncbi:MAG: acetate kinase [Deltaproteobacteria bacterium]|nr:MAG: acetate kinase [Deltaproteobacteria bacterium]